MNASELFTYNPPFFCRKIDHEAALRSVSACEAISKSQKVAAIICYAAYYHSKVRDEKTEILRLSSLGAAEELSPDARNDFHIGCWLMTGEDQWIKALADTALETDQYSKVATARWASLKLFNNCAEWKAALRRLYGDKEYNMLAGA